MITDYPEDDAEVSDPLEARQFFELMQEYRWHRGVDAGVPFEAVKAFIREHMAIRDTPA